LAAAVALVVVSIIIIIYGLFRLDCVVVNVRMIGERWLGSETAVAYCEVPS